LKNDLFPVIFQNIFFVLYAKAIVYSNNAKTTRVALVHYLLCSLTLAVMLFDPSFRKAFIQYCRNSGCPTAFSTVITVIFDNTGEHNYASSTNQYRFASVELENKIEMIKSSLKAIRGTLSSDSKIAQYGITKHVKLALLAVLDTLTDLLTACVSAGVYTDELISFLITSDQQFVQSGKFRTSNITLDYLMPHMGLYSYSYYFGKLQSTVSGISDKLFLALLCILFQISGSVVLPDGIRHNIFSPLDCHDITITTSVVIVIS
jgi:hypothetical protein